jgi:hypothetical protein
MGAVEALSTCYSAGYFLDYDVVVHLHPDVFIINEEGFISEVLEYWHRGTALFATRCIKADNNHYAFDFFAFVPDRIPLNIFSESWEEDELPEFFLFRVAAYAGLSVQVMKRYSNNHWFPRRISESLSLWHEHDLALVQKFISEQI